MLAQEQTLTLIITVPNPKMGLQSCFTTAPHSPVLGFPQGPMRGNASVALRAASKVVWTLAAVEF